jgi:hypothetical protein
MEKLNEVEVGVIMHFRKFESFKQKGNLLIKKKKKKRKSNPPRPSFFLSHIPSSSPSLLFVTHSRERFRERNAAIEIEREIQRLRESCWLAERRK